MRQYPRVGGVAKRPRPDKDGTKAYGKPCVICGRGTVGEKWIEVSYMRGDDESARVCAEHWNTPDAAVVAAWLKPEVSP